MNILKLVPSNIKILTYSVIVVIISGLLVSIHYKIDSRGYKRCEGKYIAAEKSLKEKARRDILYLEDKYDRIKSEIIRTDGEDRICGPRVIHAINSMPTNSLISE